MPARADPAFPADWATEAPLTRAEVPALHRARTPSGRPVKPPASAQVIGDLALFVYMKGCTAIAAAM
jgi:hypothetical protein